MYLSHAITEQVYGVIRVVALVNVLANLVQNNLRHSIGCQGWLYFEFVRTV